ncbi:PHR1-LIKE 1 protein [Nymphaea thermarum]|nr:PHR1-LIKE 1 protein [Nymphaea thermarum]
MLFDGFVEELEICSAPSGSDGENASEHSFRSSLSPDARPLCPSSSRNQKLLIRRKIVSSESGLDGADSFSRTKESNIHSPSSTFCTNLYLSTSTCSENYRHLGNLPFLPNPTSPSPASVLNPSNSFAVDLALGHQCSKDEYVEENTNDYLSLNGDCVADPEHLNDDIAYPELQEWDFLSDQLDMAITDDGKNPSLDVKATPKGVLKLMNVEGLTIYHVKSHLQKYRFAKYLPETKEGKNMDAQRRVLGSSRLFTQGNESERSSL